MAGSHDEPTTGAHSSPPSSGQPVSAGKPASHLPSQPGPDRESSRYTLAWMTHDYTHERSRGDIHLLTSAPPANATRGPGLHKLGPFSAVNASTTIAAIADPGHLTRDHVIAAAADPTRLEPAASDARRAHDEGAET